jgi:hypothetical protein
MGLRSAAAGVSSSSESARRSRSTRCRSSFADSAASSAAVALETAARAVAVGLPGGGRIAGVATSAVRPVGRLLVLTGAAVLAVTLSLSDDAVLYSTGRVVH